MEQALVRFGRFVNDTEGNGRGTVTSSWRSSCWTRAKAVRNTIKATWPPVRQYEAVGHAVRAVYFYSGMLILRRKPATRTTRALLLSLWDNMVNKKFYVTGALAVVRHRRASAELLTEERGLL